MYKRQSYACARIGWPLEATEVISLVGRPLDTLSLALHPGRRLLVLSADAATPAAVAALLTARGYGTARLRVLEKLGHAHERQLHGPADGWPHPPGDPLNVIAVDLGDGPRTSLVPGLPDTAYESDGQLTKRHVRAATLATLAPPPANCSGTSAAAPARSPSSGCVRTATVRPSPSSATPSGPSGSPATPPHSVCPGCGW